MTLKRKKRNVREAHTNLKGLKKVNGEFGLILLCYNLMRVLSILGENGLKEALNQIKNMSTSMLDYIKHQIEIHFTQRHKPSQ